LQIANRDLWFARVECKAQYANHQAKGKLLEPSNPFTILELFNSDIEYN